MSEMIPELSSDQELGKWIWHNLVPKSNQADSVQGELLRANEKLRHECHNNGNGNWDDGFEILINFLASVLCEKRRLFKDPSKGLRKDLNRLRDYDHPYLEDDLFDRIEQSIFKFCRSNRKLIPHKNNPDLKR